MVEQKYPVGIQTFEKIRNTGFTYVDKTKYIFELIKEGGFFFLSRPRRFGKSLLMSTIEALYLGKRELFDGLYIADMEWDWIKHPVFHFDLNGKPYTSTEDLDNLLAEQIRVWEAEYGYSLEEKGVDERFRTLIRTAFEKTGHQVVILIDEYDQPLLHNIDKERSVILEKMREKLQAFYSVMKSHDKYICFGMLTGVTKFSKVSVFSGLNNLNDISLDIRYNAICGISETELQTHFQPGINRIAQNLGMTVEETKERLRKEYDGYHFAKSGEGIYNPFSLLNAFVKEEFGRYWFASGNPTFLNKVLTERNWNLNDLSGSIRSGHILSGSDIYLTDPMPLLYQTGYLTITGYDTRFEEYKLGYPNEEVTQGFFEALLKYISRDNDPQSFIKDFTKRVERGDAEGFMTTLQSFLSDFPYDQIRDLEVHWQNVMYLIMKLMGFYVHTEYKTSDGRIDMVVKTERYIYVMEFKLRSTSKAAIQQIREKEYALPFVSDSREVILIGAAFSSRTRRLKKWLIEIA